MKLTQEELAALRGTKSADEWNKICDRVKRDRGGQYPSDWYALVVLSGVMSTTQTNWK